MGLVRSPVYNVGKRGGIIMQEVFAILVAMGALIAGLLVISWAYGDHRSRSKPS
jgi:hypothetical protein